MRSRIRPAQRVYNPFREWTPWYAWYPKRIYLGPYTPNHSRPWQWVWKEIIEYKRSTDYACWEYRIHPRDEPSSCSSTESHLEEKETS